MICPKDSTQMVQKDQLGGGKSFDDFYETWEIKVCPVCGRLVKEYYSVKVIDEKELHD